jgi:hypothetical protein
MKYLSILLLITIVSCNNAEKSSKNLETANATKLEIRDSVVVEKKVIVENQEKNKEPIDSVFR